MARAKRTHRAEARRRYRSEQSLTAQDDADTIDGRTTPRRLRRTDPSAGTAQASAPRQGVGNAFRAAFRPVDIRADLGRSRSWSVTARYGSRSRSRSRRPCSSSSSGRKAGATSSVS